MSKKMYTVDPERCTGCRLCEQVCSVKHFGVFNPGLASIHIVKWDTEGYYLPVRCQHCIDAPCMAVCPKGAIYRDVELDSVKVDYDACIGCKMCVSACPFGAMRYSPKNSKVFKCDLCDGDPQCVRFCDMKAVNYVEAERAQCAKMRESAEQYLQELRKHGSEL